MSVRLAGPVAVPDSSVSDESRGVGLLDVVTCRLGRRSSVDVQVFDDFASVADRGRLSVAVRVGVIIVVVVLESK